MYVLRRSQQTFRGVIGVEMQLAVGDAGAYKNKIDGVS